MTDKKEKMSAEIENEEEQTQAAEDSENVQNSECKDELSQHMPRLKILKNAASRKLKKILNLPFLLLLKNCWALPIICNAR